MGFGKKLAALLFVLCSAAAAHATACPTGYGYAKEFVVSYQILGGSTLTNFMVPIPFNGVSTSLTGLSSTTSNTLPDLKATGSGGKIQSSGDDIVFCDAYSSGNLLNFERTSYSSTTGAAEFWVGRTLSGSADTPIWMFYGKASDSDHSNAAAAWSAAGYVYVNHFPNGSTLSVADATGNTTPTNNGATATAAIINGGAAFDGSTSYVDAGGSVNESTVTVEAWVYPTAAGSLPRIAGNLEISTFNGYELYLQSYQPRWHAATGGTISEADFPNTIPSSSWTHLAVTQSASTGIYYVNGIGVAPSGNVSNAIGNSNLNFEVGRFNAGADSYFQGSIEEVRVASVQQSAGWEQANYTAETAPSSFAIMVDANSPAGLSSGPKCIPVPISYTPTSTLTNYPFLVRGIYPWMAYASSGGYAVNGNNGYDIRWFSNSTCSSAVSFERAYYTSGTGDSAWYVQVPSLSSSGGNTVYASIGASSFNTDASTLWMGTYNYVGAYHGGPPTTLTTTDSGSAGLDISTGVAGTPLPAATPVGGGFWCTNDGVCDLGWGPTVSGDSIAAHGYPGGSSVVHERLWFRSMPLPDTGSADSCIGGFGKANTTGQTGFCWNSSSNALGMNSIGWGETPNTGVGIAEPGIGSSPTFLMDQAWHLLDFDYPTAAGAMSTSTIYIDGSPAGTPIYGTTGSSGVLDTDVSPCCGTDVGEIRIFRDAAHGINYFTGYIAEWETSSVSQSAALVAARYANEIDPSTFYSFGTAAPFTPPGSTNPQPIIEIITKLEEPHPWQTPNSQSTSFSNSRTPLSLEK